MRFRPFRRSLPLRGTASLVLQTRSCSVLHYNGILHHNPQVHHKPSKYHYKWLNFQVQNTHTVSVTTHLQSNFLLFHTNFLLRKKRYTCFAYKFYHFVLKVQNKRSARRSRCFFRKQAKRCHKVAGFLRVRSTKQSKHRRFTFSLSSQETTAYAVATLVLLLAPRPLLPRIRFAPK